MWRIRSDLLAAKNDDLAIQYVLDQLRTPEPFLAKVRHLYDHPLEESFDLLDFKDGRVFERFSCPMLVEGHPLGRVWSFRNITEIAAARDWCMALIRRERPHLRSEESERFYENLIQANTIDQNQ